MYRTHFVHLFIDGRLSCFYLLAIVNIAWMCGYLFKSLFLIILDLYLGVKLQGHMVVLYFTFWEVAKLFSVSVVSFYIPTRNVWFQFLHTVTISYYFPVFLKLQRWCEMVCRRGFDLYFLND